MDNPGYAEKYADGADKSDIAGKLKEATDARWVEGEDGRYFGGGVLVAPESENWMGSLGCGRESYPQSWLSTRAGVEGIATTSESSFLYAGVGVGVRAQTPTRSAAFVGIDGGGGLAVGDLILASLADEDENDVDSDGLASVYPEVGAHFWLNGKSRVTFLGRYMVTTAGRRHDGWLVGGQLARF